MLVSRNGFFGPQAAAPAPVNTTDLYSTGLDCTSVSPIDAFDRFNIVNNTVQFNTVYYFAVLCITAPQSKPHDSTVQCSAAETI